MTSGRRGILFDCPQAGFLATLGGMTSVMAWAALVVLSAASFFFALAETSLFSLNKWQLRQLRERGAGGAVVDRLLAQPQSLLAALVLGNSFANAGIVGVSLWMALAQGWPMMVVLPSVLFFVLFGCEAAPKTLAVRAPERWSLRVAPIMGALESFSRPLLAAAQRLTGLILGAAPSSKWPAPAALSDAEYQELLEAAFQQGALAAGEKEIILQIIRLDRRQAREVMKPRTQMASIPDTLTEEEMAAAARRYRHRRLPIFDETPDTIVGVLNTREFLLNPGEDLALVVEFPSFVPESANLLQLLKSLQRQQRGLAIVMDEFGGTAGVVTIEDILAEVLGELRAEQDLQPAVMERLGPQRWRVSGGLRVDSFRREYPQLAPSPEVETMAGLVLDRLEVVPAPGDAVTLDGLRLTVESADERRVHGLLVEALRRR